MTTQLIMTATSIQNSRMQKLKKIYNRGVIFKICKSCSEQKPKKAFARNSASCRLCTRSYSKYTESGIEYMSKKFGTDFKRGGQ